MVGQEEDEGCLEDTTEIDNAGEMILLEKAGFVHRQATALSFLFGCIILDVWTFQMRGSVQHILEDCSKQTKTEQNRTNLQNMC